MKSNPTLSPVEQKLVEVIGHGVTFDPRPDLEGIPQQKISFKAIEEDYDLFLQAFYDLHQKVIMTVMTEDMKSGKVPEPYFDNNVPKTAKRVYNTLIHGHPDYKQPFGEWIKSMISNVLNKKEQPKTNSESDTPQSNNQENIQEMTVLNEYTGKDIYLMNETKLRDLAKTCEKVLTERDIEPLIDGISQIPQQTPQCLPATVILHTAAFCNDALECLGIDLSKDSSFKRMSEWRLSDENKKA